MNYPVWEVAGLGSPWVIGIIAIFHIMIAHFAVGGGLYLVMAEQKAIKENRREWLPLIERHSKFFLILTGVFGAVSGVAIWFSIGLVHPEATSTLIHNFVFGWAIEWVFFIVELSAALVYYYTWNRIPEKLHLKIGWLYAGASFCTLVIINGILTFMLTPGKIWLEVAGTGAEASKFWFAFFNQTYWPGLFLRILSCTALAGVWGLVTLSRHPEEETEAQIKNRIALTRWSAGWVTPMFLLMPVIFLWFVANVPSENRALLSLGMTTIGTGAFTQITRIGLLMVMTTGTIAGVVYFFAYKSPRDFSYGHAISVLVLALMATASGEYAREALRKPYVIGRHMYSNGIRLSELKTYNAEGYLTHSMWVPKESTPLERGKLMFRGQCMSCHTTDGYRSMRRLIGERNDKSIAMLLNTLHEAAPTSSYRAYMPPLVGTPEELNDLGVYLRTLSSAPPQTTKVAAGN